MQSPSLNLLQKQERLASSLEALHSTARPGHLSLAISLDGKPLFLDYEGPGCLRRIERERCALMEAGCLAKPLTASLLAEAMRMYQLDWTSQVNDVLRVRGVAGSTLTGITFSHLLNHTHGLDASMIEAVPRTPHGLIDAIAFCQQLATRPLSLPGELYSYSNAGTWLAGAALERLTGMAYSQLLKTSACLASSDLAQITPSSVCPATGGSLTLTTAEWLSFLEVHARAEPFSQEPVARNLASLRSSPALLPGWSPAEQAACRGWKYYGEEWFGHSATMPTRVGLLRFNPGTGAAIVMSASTDILLFAISRLFRDYFPEAKNLTPPRLLTAPEAESQNPDAYVGVYARAKTQIEITTSNEGGLSFAIASEDPNRRTPPQLLQAAVNDIFLPAGKRTSAVPFIQFLRSPRCGSFSHLWNGKYVWRRQ